MTRTQQIAVIVVSAVPTFIIAWITNQPAATAAAATAVYATLLYFQRDDMKRTTQKYIETTEKQVATSTAQLHELRKHHQDLLDLQAADLQRRSSALSIEGSYRDGVDLYAAILNSGPAPAQNCVPILREVLQLNPGANPASNSPDDWRPLQRPPAALGWADQLNPGPADQHVQRTSNPLNTQPKDLVPGCPYYFRLATISITMNSGPVLQIHTIHPHLNLPNPNPPDIYNVQPAGHYKFRIEASSGNGGHAERLYLIHVDPNATNASGLTATALPAVDEAALGVAAS